MTCICCGGTTLASIYSARSFDITRCDACGLGRTEIPAGFDFQAYYSQDYFQGQLDDGYADYTGSEETLRAEFRGTLEHILSLKPQRGHLLEFGCAYGFFLLEAARHFERASGIELCADAVDFCRSRGLDVVHGVVDPSTLPGEIDIAVGLDVIEHIPEPHEAVRMIAERLRPGGMLVLTTGDWASLLARLTGVRWRLMTPPQHLSFFTPASMRAMLSSAGLRTIELSHPWKKVPLSLFAYQFQRILGRKPHAIPSLNRWSIPVNLWDAMRVVAVK